MAEYYYSDLSGGQAGPVGKEALPGLWAAGQINENTQIWYVFFRLFPALIECIRSHYPMYHIIYPPSPSPR